MMSKKEVESQIDQVQKDIADSGTQIESLTTELEELSYKAIESVDGAKAIQDQRHDIQATIEATTGFKVAREERLEVLKNILSRHNARSAVKDWERNCKRVIELMEQQNNRVEEVMRLRSEIDDIRGKMDVSKAIKKTVYWNERTVFMPNAPWNLLTQLDGKRYLIQISGKLRDRP